MYKIDFADGYLGDYEISTGTLNNLNAYARVVSISQNTIKLNNIIPGAFVNFDAGSEILLHVSASNRTNADFLGQFMFAYITLVADDIFTLDKNVFDVDLNYEYVQAVTVPHFATLKLTNSNLTPPPFNPFKFTGGILIFRCFNDFIMQNSSIDLTDCGIPANRQNSLRPITTQETARNGLTDNANLSGQENFITAERFLLNAGDGAVFIHAKNFSADENSRIGNPKTYGLQRSRAAVDSYLKPSNSVNVGGSTILIAADSILNFSPKIIAKYRDTNLREGKGLARCFIASNTILPVDECLYSFDILYKRKRLEELGVFNFGSGSLGDVQNINCQLNNYASVRAITRAGHRFTYSDKTLNGLAQLKVGAMVLLQVIQKKEVAEAGRIICTRVLDAGDNFIVTETPLDVDLDNYSVQIVTVPEFANLTIDSNFDKVKKYDGESGGILAVAVSGTLDITDGKMNVEGAGGAEPYGRAGLDFIGNSQNYNRLPMGQGHGSVFILANKIVMNENTRIGALYSGLGEGGKLGGSNYSGTNPGGGVAGAPDEDGTGSGGGFHGAGGIGGLGGSAIAGAFSSNVIEIEKESGSYGGRGDKAGASIFIVADMIEGFTVSAIATGGGSVEGKGSDGSAGYGGGGEGAGCGGWAFVYCNCS